jgi:phosphatidylserine/phosphatidylglycerophosphate/cardiolipin synthase-like enzyme
VSLSYLKDADPPRGKVTPLIDGLAFFNDFFKKIETLTAGDRVYIMNWYMQPDFYRLKTVGQSLEKATKASPLFRELQTLVDKGVDVRVLLWMNTNFFRPSYPPGFQRQLVRTVHFPSQQLYTAATVHHWRAQARLEAGPGQASLADAILVNTLDAPTGGCHAKFSLVLRQDGTGYEGIGYTGGLDFGHGRYGAPRHENDRWHDVQARVEGPEIVSDLVDFYVDMWNENIARLHDDLLHDRRATIRIAPDLLGEGQKGQPEYTFPCVPTKATKIVRAKIDLVSSASTWPHRVQSLRTIPHMIPWPFLGEDPIEFAPNGAFEFRDTLQHAIAQATEYIYIEDQGMESLDIFDWILDAMRNNDALHVVCVTGARDPADPPTKHLDRTLLAWWFYGRLNDDQRKRFHFVGITDYVVHSKVFLIDDEVAFIGSAGMFTRSLTQDLEHAVAFVADDADTAVRDFRIALWAELFDVEPPEFKNRFPTIEDALAAMDHSKVDNETELTFPCYAENTGQSTNFVYDTLLPVTVDGVLQQAPVSASDEKDALKRAGAHPLATIVAKFGFHARGLDWLPLKIIVVVYVEPVKVTANDGSPYEVLQKKIVGPFRRSAFTPFPPTASVFGPASVTDDRLRTGIPPFTVHEDAKPISFVQNLADEQLMIECVGGANISKVRRILTHVDNTITFEPFTDPLESDFEYRLVRPCVVPIDLESYFFAPGYKDDPHSFPSDLAVHMLTHELPFTSLFDPSQITSRSIPMPITGRIAINQLAPIVVFAAPTETITWQCDEPDAQPTSGSGGTFEVRFATSGPKLIQARHVLSDGPPITYDYRFDVIENSGMAWVERFPGSVSLDDLVEPFRSRVSEFLAALTAAGLPYKIFQTWRPKQRAYLMAWSYRIARQNRDPREIDTFLDDVPISWVHYDADGDPDLAASKLAAEAMVAQYGIGPSGASENSRHVGGTAIDLRVDISTPKVVAMKSGTHLLIDSEARLTRVGRSYNIRRLGESNHWSLSGH